MEQKLMRKPIQPPPLMRFAYQAGKGNHFYRSPFTSENENE
jgi:hypothetical protein